MRLIIDADALSEKISEWSKVAQNINANDLMEFIHLESEKQSVDYDLDEIVKQLEEIQRIMETDVDQNCFGKECECEDCTVCVIKKAIDIVKGGGVNV